MSPIACPRMVLRGLETSASGEKKKRYAVGPRDGKTNGLPVRRASRAEQPNGDEAIHADIDCPHKTRRKVLQEPFHPHVRKQNPDMLESVVLSARIVMFICRKSSDVREQIEVFIVFVLAALSEADGLFRFDEFDSLNPLDHLVAKLIFNAQPQWRSIDLGQAAFHSSQWQAGIPP